MPKLTVVACAFVVLSKLAVATAADLPANQVTNPSLEEKVADDGLPPGWGKFFSNPAGAYSATIVDGGRTGKKQMRLECVGDKEQAQFGVMPANRVPLDNTKRYVARGWVKVAGGKRATAAVKLHYYDAGGAYLNQTNIGVALPGNDDWQLVTVTDRADEFPLAKFIGLAIACTGDAQAEYDDLELLAFDKDALPADFDATYGITLSPQLAVLSRRVGTWVTTMKIKPCVWVPQGLETTGIETIRWTLGGELLEGRLQNPDTGVEQLSLMTYDARDHVYRSWFFGANGNLPRSPSIGRWDKDKEILTFETEQKDEFTSVVRMKLIGNDAIRWQGIWKDKDGQVLLDAEGSAKRRLPDQTPPTSAEAPKVQVKAPPYSIETTTALDGTWLAESVTSNGEVAPAAALKQSWFKINAPGIAIKLDGPEAKGKFTIDSGKTPTHMNVTLDKSPGIEVAQLVGIYQLTGDRLEICLRAKDEAQDVRPTDFSSKANSRRILVVLKKKMP